VAITLLCAIHFALFATAIGWVTPIVRACHSRIDPDVDWVSTNFWLVALLWIPMVRGFCWLARGQGLRIAAVLAVAVHAVVIAGVMLMLWFPQQEVVG